MKRHFSASAALVLALGTAPALAASSTTDGGKAPDGLKQLFGEKLDAIAPAFSVNRSGDTTRVAIDLAMIVEKLGVPGLSISSKPIALIFTNAADGTVRHATDGAQDVDVSYELALKQRQTGKIGYSGFTFDGVYDPKLAFYRTMAISVAKSVSEGRQPEVGMSATATIGQNTMNLTAEAVGDGLVSVKSQQAMKGFAEKISIDPQTAEHPTAGPRMDIEIDAPSLDGSFHIDRLHTFGVRDLISFLLDHASKEDIAAAQGDFKDRLRAVIPLFDAMGGAATISGLNVQTPFGRGSVGAVGLKLDVNTASPSSSVAIGYSFDQIAVDSVFIPAWAKDLVPTKLAFAFDVRDFDVKSGLNAMIDKVDMMQPDPLPAAAAPAVGAAFLPTGVVTAVLMPSEIVAPAYSVSWQGDVKIANEKAKTHVEVHAKGLDKVIQALSKVQQEGAPQAVIGLYAAKALAKPEGTDAYFWAIDVDEAGDLLVNGASVGPKKKI